MCAYLSHSSQLLHLGDVSRWEQEGYFAPDDTATGEPFTMSMPPANVTGRLHMGHAMFATLQVRLDCVDQPAKRIYSKLRKGRAGGGGDGEGEPSRSASLDVSGLLMT